MAQFDKHIVSEIEALDPSTACAYQDCGHPLSDHDKMDVTTFGDAGVEKAIFPCVSVNLATRGVCACRNFEVPQTVNPVEVQPVPLSGDIPAHNLAIGNFTLQLWHNGTVTWKTAE